MLKAIELSKEPDATVYDHIGDVYAALKQPDKARATYQRVIETYTNPTERTYREQASRALKDINMLAPSVTTAP